MTAKKKGRPAKPAAQHRTKPLYIMLTPAEHRALKDHAAREALDVSVVVRQALRPVFTQGAP